MRRVVITGLGAISPLGNSVDETFAGLTAGKSGIVEITKFDATDYPSRIAGEVKNFDATPIVGKKDLKKMDTFIQYAVCASVEAIKDSGIDLEKVDVNRFGTTIGSGIGGLPMIEREHQKLVEKGPRRVTPFFIPAVIVNMAAGNVSIFHGLKGPNCSPATACATGNHAIGDAYRLIRIGMADAMIAGGTEAVVTPMALAGFGAMKALSTRNDEPERASRPFDTGRDGFVLGEGCGLLILEEYEHAKARGAKIYAEIIGYGMTADAYHITSPSEDGDGPYRVMRAALEDAQVDPSQIDLVNAHGTSTPTGDSIEAGAVQRILGDHIKKVMVHSTKSMSGHLLGAAGGLESVVVAKTLETGIVHPTANLEDQDPACNFDAVKGDARQAKVETVLSNSFGFGGTNAALVFRKV